MTVVMLYHTKVKEDSVEKMDKLRESFRKLYDQHGIDVIGRWKSVETPHESYYMVRYDSMDDYQNKTRTLHEDEEYLRLTAQLNEIRTDFKAIQLVPQ
ncbi:MAG: hypothetical protein ACFFCP_07330 [Promethearchaeota archaeon]